jgi:hypothetical protein
MKKPNSIWLNSLFFLSGLLICYVCVQFKYLDIEYKFNVPELIVSIGTAIIGIYIAVSLQKSHSRNQKLADYLQQKTDKLWDKCFSFATILETGNPIIVSDLAKTITGFGQDLESIKKIYVSFELKNDNIAIIEKCIDDLDDLLNNHSVISGNLVNYRNIQNDVINATNKLSQAFADTLKSINHIN